MHCTVTALDAKIMVKIANSFRHYKQTDRQTDRGFISSASQQDCTDVQQAETGAVPDVQNNDLG